MAAASLGRGAGQGRRAVPGRAAAARSRGQRIDAEVEVLVVDSGSRDGSADIARAHGAQRDRDRPAASSATGAPATSPRSAPRGDVIAFLTQDATPAVRHWLARLVAPLDDSARVGLAFGPHLPRPDTSPMIARELTRVLRERSPTARCGSTSGPIPPTRPPASSRTSTRPCCARAGSRCASATSPTPRTRRSRATRWRPAGARRTCPARASCTRTTIRSREFMRRYFDEYRGPAGDDRARRAAAPAPRARPARVRAQVAGDLRYMRDTRLRRRGRVPAWALRSARHHAGRAVAAALGSRHDRVPAAHRAAPVARGPRRRAEPGAELRAPAREAAAPTATSPCASTRAAAPAPLAVPSPHDGERSRCGTSPG